MTSIQHIVTYRGRLDRFDAVIVGSGPSGATVARTLAEQGKDVLILEMGGLASPGAILSTHQGAFSRAISGAGLRDGNPWTACCVGGGMQFYSAITFRYREADLRVTRHISSDLDMDWPIELQALDEHYSYIEALLGLSGEGDYPISARGKKIASAMSLLGYRPSCVPLAIRPPSHPSGCSYCAACDSRFCPSGAKASIMTRSVLDDTGLPGNITLLYGCLVKSIKLDNEGRAASLECFIPFSSECLSVPVAKVICCANAVQSSALLLRSRSSFAPRGIGNEHDLVGRGLSFKISGYSSGFNPKWQGSGDLSLPHRGAHSTIYTEDFYQGAQVPSGLGGLIYEAAASDPERNIGRVRIHYLAGEEAWSHNRITLDDEVDGFGVPLIRYSYKNSESDKARIGFLADRADEILQEAGALTVEREVPVHEKGSSHLHGTARAGFDASRSVVDTTGRVHGYDNIYIMDASVMNFAGSWNPTHTIMANARRMATAIA